MRIYVVKPLYIPIGASTYYKAAEYWKEFSTIEEKEMEGIKQFEYTIIDDGSVSVKAINTNLSGEIVIPEEVEIDGNKYSVTAVASNGFYKCSKITSVTLPNTIVSLNDYAFCCCNNLKSLVFPNSLKSIGQWALDECESLTSVSIPDGVTSIGFRAFSLCSNLESVTLPDALSSINPCVFMATAISSITLPESLKSIGYSAFSGCTKLKEITIPQNVNSIGYGVFSRCDALKDIKIDEGNTYFISKDGMLLSKDSKILYAYAFANPAEHLVIPESVISLYGYSLFSGNKKLKSISVPSGVKYIDEYTFRECTALTNVYLPDGITTLEYGAFYGCSSLKTIIIPQSLNKFGNHVYEGCTDVDSVIVRQYKPLEIDSYLFEETVYKNATLYVPTGRAKYFKEIAGWAKFAKIQEIEMEGLGESTSPYDNIEDNQMILGYYRSNNCIAPTGSGYGGRVAGLYKVCISFDEMKIKPFVGNKITNIRFALVNTDIQNTKVWIGSTRNKKDLLVQRVNELQTGWNEIKLDEPYEITGDSIFVGIEYKQSDENYPISVVSDGAEMGSSYFYGPYDSERNGVWIDDDEESVSIQCIVEGDKIPLYDVRAVNMTLSPKYLKAGEKATGYFYLKNWGKKTVENYEYSICVDGEEIGKFPVNKSLSNSSATSTYFNFTSDGSLKSGRHDLNLSVTSINGEVPQFSGDDKKNVQMRVYSQSMNRQKVLLQHYTATWCPYCPRTDRSIENLMGERDDIALVSSHDDDMSCEAGDEYLQFTDYLPSTRYDRYADIGDTDFGYISLDNAKALPAFANVNIKTSYNSNNRQLGIIVSGECLDDFFSVEQFTSLTVLLTEDNVVSPQYDGEQGITIKDYKHQGVLRKNVSAIWGDPVTWDGNNYSMNYSIILDEAWNPDNMNVVAFLAKPFTGENYDEMGVVNCNSQKIIGNQLKGDVNGDLTVDVADIATLIDVMAAGTNDANADVNKDGKVDVADIANVIDVMTTRARQ